MNRRRFLFVLVAAFAAMVTFSQASQAQGEGSLELALISEMTGMVASYEQSAPDCDYSADYGVYLCPERSTNPPAPDPAARAAAQAILDGGGTLLLIPDSSNDRVMAFDAVTGALLDPDFIPSDPDNLSAPVEAFASADGSSILVSDQLKDVVQAYEPTGTYLGVFAPAGGSNTAILNNVRGMALRDNGNLLVTSADADIPDYVAEFDSAGNYIGAFIASGSGGIDSPYDVTPYEGDWLVPGSSSENVLRYDDSGAFLSQLIALDRFPEQVIEADNGNVLIANYLGSQSGVVEVQSDGTLVGVYIPPNLTGFRGVYELPNGNLLVSNADGVHEITRTGDFVDSKITGIQSRYIREYSQSTGPTATPIVTATATALPPTATATQPVTAIQVGGLSSDGGSSNGWLFALLGLTALGATLLVAQRRRR